VVQVDAAGAAASIPLGPDSRGVDLAKTVALTFSIRGEQGQEAIRLWLSDTGGDRARVELGEIFEYLPLGISTEWKQVVIEIPSGAEKALPRATQLVVGFDNGQTGSIKLKGVEAIPRLRGSEGWQTLTIPLSDYSLSSPDDISGLVLDRLEGVGTRIQNIRAKEEAKGEAARVQAPSRSQAPAIQDGYYRVTDFDSGIPERLRGRFGTFVRLPSSASLDLSLEVRPSAGGRALRLDYTKKPEGFCGLWIHLMEQDRSSRTAYFDASSFAYLSFWVRGEQGGEDALVQLADERWEQRGDSIALGALSELVAGGVTREWREATISLQEAMHMGLDLRRLATLSLKIVDPVSGTLYLDDVSFKTARDVVVPASPVSSERRAGRRHRRATWIWDPTAAFRDPEEWSALFEFARVEGIDVFFVQIHCNYQVVEGQVVCALANEEPFRRLAREAHREGIEVHALDGYKYHVLPRWRPRVLAQVRAVLDYNARGEPSERFDGVHHDNEPYLLRGFSGALRDELLVHFLELTYACQQLIIRSGQPITYGVDIPFWYDGVEVTWRGQRRTMSAHTIDIVDEVGLMAYRTNAYGRNGVLALARQEVDYAGRRGKRAFVALETTPLPDRTSYSFANGLAKNSIREGNKQPAAYLLIEEWDGVAIFYWKETSPADDGTMASSLQELQAARDSHRILLSVEKATVPGSRLSFAASTQEELKAVVKQVFEELGDEPGFAGVAIHDYAGYRKLARQP
jgi:hypothetical protein